MTNRRWVAVTVLMIGVAWAGAAETAGKPVATTPAAEPAGPVAIGPRAKAVLAKTTIPKGICVVLGLPEANEAGLVVDLAAGSEFLVYFQSSEAKEVLAVRRAAQAAGLLGSRVFADRGSPERIHLADNLAGLIWVSAAVENAVSQEELLRVLHPEGKALRGEKEIVKPFPPGIDSWSSPYHGADNNPQSEDQVALLPYLTQFLAEPMFSPMPEVTVAAGGRVFKAFGMRATHANQNDALNTLMGINGYNGAILWKRSLREGFMLDRNTIIATSEVLYLADDESCKLIDARTGRINDQIVIPEGVGDGKVWKWMALDVRPDGKVALLALVGGQEVKPRTQISRDGGVGGWAFPSGSGWNYSDEKTNFGFGRTIVAIDPNDKKVLWKHDEQEYLDGRGLCMKNGRIYYYSPAKFLGCLDARTGRPIWKTSDPELLKAIGPTGPAWATEEWGFATVAFVKCTDKYLFFAGPQRPNLVVASAEDGKFVHQQPAGYVHLVLREDGFYAIGGGASATAKTATKMAYGTWKTLAKLPGRRGCTRATGSADSVFYRAGEGTWQVRVSDNQAVHIAPMRPPCPDGVIIANGMLYWGPWMCACPLSLYGHVALAPAGKFNYRPGADESRLEPGDGDPTAVQKIRVAPGDWPCYQGDNQRSATTGVAAPQRVTQQWVFQPLGSPGRPTAPVTAGDLVFVGDERGVLRALDAVTGEPKWEAYTGGAIFLSPAVWEGRVYVGSADGRVYAFEAATGRRLWSLRAAPVQRWIPVYGKLLSTWPVAGGVVVQDGVVYAAAGIVNHDGTHVYALDAITGRLKWYNDSSGTLSAANEGVSLQGELCMRNGALCVPGGTMCPAAMYDLKTGQCQSRVSQGGRTLFYPYYPQYGQYATLNHGLPDGRRLALDGRLGLTMLPAPKPDQPPPTATATSPAARTAAPVVPLWSKSGQTFNGFVVTPDALVATGNERAKGPAGHFVAAIRLEDGSDAWRQGLPAPAVKGGVALDHAARVFVALDDGRVVCLVPAR